MYACNVLTYFLKYNLARLKFPSINSSFYLSNNSEILHGESRQANKHFLC